MQEIRTDTKDPSVYPLFYHNNCQARCVVWVHLGECFAQLADLMICLHAPAPQLEAAGHAHSVLRLYHCCEHPVTNSVAVDNDTVRQVFVDGKIMSQRIDHALP